ncbi:flagellar biosynthetic protein FliO [Neobacillus rhizophilus]|uniref:Flagellar biosynthetic protein FliO n=1 Tax=Neobacillus rhizophilus TaxID=2833579 RepID=A0A942U4G8_9BACI|nr:flagellar biosynthetic protein FliO [Neobacillus rhizophilus]MBS4213050.1 flagellar biosynthetic protein FliO [Neobacillus rhizophilus]
MQIVSFFKKISLTFAVVFLFSSLNSHQVVFGAGSGTVYDAYSKDQQTNTVQGNHSASMPEQPSLVPSFIKFIFSFAAIIILLLLCLKFLKSKSKPILSKGPIYSLGGYPLGGSKSVQMVMIGKTLYILGIGNEVRLLQTIEPGEEQDLIMQSLVEQTAHKKQPINFRTIFKRDGAKSTQKTEDWEQTLLSQINQVKQTSIPINKLKD